jgi:hypothetical protein
VKSALHNMKFQCAIAIALAASSAIALSIPSRAVDAPTTTNEKLYTLELAPGETKQVTEAQKWELHNVNLTAAFHASSANNSRLECTSWILQTTPNSTKHRTT